MPTIQKTRRMFEFIRGYIASNNEAPLLREIGEHFNMSSLASVYSHLTKMENNGWIKRTPNISRGIEIAGRPTDKAA